MADSENRKPKRNHSELSSLSESDTSMNTTPTKQPQKKPNTHQNELKQEDNAMKDIYKQLKEINEKLTNVMTKNDPTLKTLIKDNIKQMKDELLESVIKRIEILEKENFDKDKENEQLKIDMKKMQQNMDTLKAEQVKLRNDMIYSERKTDEFLNNHEQYSRINNIRITGIPEEKFPKIIYKNIENDTENDEKRNETENRGTDEKAKTYAKAAQKSADENKKADELVHENAEQTTDIVIKKINSHIPGIKLKREDICISHRMPGKPPKSGDRPRSIIVQFMSRLTKDKIMRNRPLFPKAISIMDDMTSQNYQAFQSVKYKKPDLVKSAWFRNGKIFYKNHFDIVQQVQYKNFGWWLSAPWPERRANASGSGRY